MKPLLVASTAIAFMAVPVMAQTTDQRQSGPSVGIERGTTIDRDGVRDRTRIEGRTGERDRRNRDGDRTRDRSGDHSRDRGATTGQGATQFAPGQMQQRPGDAKRFAPGQQRGPAKRSAPGQRQQSPGSANR